MSGAIGSGPVSVSESSTTSIVDLPHRVVLSISSDFGIALANAWLDQGLVVAGTYRTASSAVEALRTRGVKLVQCDFADPRSVDGAVRELRSIMPEWDVLVAAPATLEPVGPFLGSVFDEWEDSVAVNFTAQLRAIHGLMPARRLASERGPMVLFFAGGGTNNATVNFSAYTIGKIASIKMVELLDAEVPDTRFSILGPGWVKTKIHQPTLDAGEDRAGGSYERTRRMLASDDCVPMDRVVECCDWLIGAPREAIGGRNLSLVYDLWEDPQLLDCLIADPDMYKLRRHGNDRMVRGAEALALPGPAEQLATVIAALPQLHRLHAHDTASYGALATAARNAAAALFGPNRRGAQPLGPFGQVVFPYTTLGAIDTVDFFGLDELIIFAFCWVNRRRYRRVADVGANIGLHSVVFSRCGFDVRSYEPDPGHVALLKETLAANAVTTAEVIPAAVSDRRGEAEFVRVLGNTTSSHLAGAKNPYGPLERFSVPLVPISEIAAWADFLKIDAEGHEVVILRAIPRDAWTHLDAIVEVGTPDNAAALFDHFRDMPVGLFAQKTGWSRVSRLADMPISYREGSLFITAKAEMPWAET